MMSASEAIARVESRYANDPVFHARVTVRSG